MSLGKRESRKQDKAGIKPKRWFRRSSSPQPEAIENFFDEAQLSDFDQLRESALETKAFETKLLSVELSEPSSSSATVSVEGHHESGPDDQLPASFDIVEESSTHANFIADSTVSYDHTETGADLVASENWLDSSADTFNAEQRHFIEASWPETGDVYKDSQFIE